VVCKCQRMEPREGSSRLLKRWVPNHCKQHSCRCDVPHSNPGCLLRSPSLRTHQSSVHLTIHRRLDYCNSVLSEVPNISLHLLQLALNKAARLVFMAWWSCHVSPLLVQIKFLPIKKRMKENFQTLVFKTRNGLCPSYLTNLLFA